MACPTKMPRPKPGLKLGIMLVAPLSCRQEGRGGQAVTDSAHPRPVGTMRLTVGRQGSMKPGGCRDISGTEPWGCNNPCSHMQFSLPSGGIDVGWHSEGAAS